MYSIFNHKKFKFYGKHDIAKLKAKVKKSAKNRFRFCMHNTVLHPTQEMIICSKYFNYFRPHRHPKNTSESYHIIEGVMDVYFLSSKGKIISVVKLADNKYNGKEKRYFFYKLSNSIYHLVVPRSKWLIYHETATGPFIKKKFVKYLPSSPPENAPLKLIKYYLKEITNNNFNII